MLHVSSPGRHTVGRLLQTLDTCQQQCCYFGFTSTATLNSLVTGYVPAPLGDCNAWAWSKCKQTAPALFRHGMPTFSEFDVGVPLHSNHCTSSAPAGDSPSQPQRASTVSIPTHTHTGQPDKQRWTATTLGGLIYQQFAAAQKTQIGFSQR
jgi:hypothetical protein